MVTSAEKQVRKKLVKERMERKVNQEKLKEKIKKRLADQAISKRSGLITGGRNSPPIGIKPAPATVTRILGPLDKITGNSSKNKNEERKNEIANRERRQNEEKIKRLEQIELQQQREIQQERRNENRMAQALTNAQSGMMSGLAAVNNAVRKKSSPNIIGNFGSSGKKNESNSGGGSGGGSAGGDYGSADLGTKLAELFVWLIVSALHFGFVLKVVPGGLYWAITLFIVFFMSISFYKDKSSREHIIYFSIFTVSLAMGYVIEILKSISFGGFDTSVVTNYVVLILAFFPIIPFLYFNRMAIHGGFVRIGVYLWMILGLVFLMGSTTFAAEVVESPVFNTQEYINDGSIREAGSTLVEGITKPFRTVLDWEGTGGGLRETINVLVDPYYYSRVEDSRDDVQIGVYLEDLKPISEVLYVDEEVIVDAYLRGKTYIGEVEVATSCEGRVNNGTDEIVIPGVMEPNFPIPISDFEENTVSCLVDPKTSPANLNSEFGILMEVWISAIFNFKTGGYVTYTFMEQQELRNRIREGQDVATLLDIDPILDAIYTNGPVRLGLVDQNNPPKMPMALSLDRPILPLFGVTLENTLHYNARGRIIKINELKIIVPRPMRLNQESCKPIPFDRVIPSEESPEWQEYIWDFNNYDVRLDSRYHTFRCRLEVDPANVPSLLGTGGIAQTTLVVETDYDYELFQWASVSLIPNPADLAPGAP